MRQQIWKWLGLPVCVGIGRSKTEAKIANHIAKEKTPALTAFAISLIWILAIKNITSRLSTFLKFGASAVSTQKKLQSMGINTVLDLACAEPREMQKKFSIVMARTIYELQGISCIEIEDTPPSKKQIIKSCSFGTKVTELIDLQEAIAMHAQEACKRLRDEESLCGCLLVFVQSSPFDDSAPFYNKSITGAFSQPTDSALDFVKAATKMVSHIYKEGIKYKKCGVILTGLEPKAGHTYDLLTDFEAIEKKEQLMKTLDNVHTKIWKEKNSV